jgi:6-pyruvoyltetrahydropterin/6-carboxytetrahydropterin synthase
MSYRLIQGDLSFKFAAAHFVIGQGGCEHLHGHNYTIEVQIYGAQNEDTNLVVDFLELKPFIKTIIEELDHHILLPKNNQLLTIKEKGEELFITFIPKEKRYIFPKEDVRLLPIANTTVEELARYIAKQVRPLFDIHSNISKIEVGVFEYKGQGCWKVITPENE